MRDEAIWARIKSHPFHLSDGKTLEQRLLRLGQLGPRRTRIILEEYRRFLYLAAVAKAEVEPSAILRQVWRAHAKDHAAYATDLVCQVIGHPMPEPFDAPLPASHPAYQRTTTLYREEFGMPPMPAIWPGQVSVLSAKALRLAVPGFAVLAVWLVLSGSLPWAVVAGAGSLVCVVVGARVAPWAFRTRDNQTDLDFGNNGQGGGFDLLGNDD